MIPSYSCLRRVGESGNHRHSSGAELERLTGALNHRRLPGSGPLKRAVRNKLTGKEWPGRLSRPNGQGSAVFEGGRVRLEASTAGRGAMTAAPPSAAGGFNTSGASVRKSEEIADLIDLFSKMQYRAKEASPRVRSGVFTSDPAA